MNIKEFDDYCRQIVRIVGLENDLSLQASTNALLQKQFALGAASAFEQEFSQRLLGFVREVSNSNLELESFLNNKAIKRQYHTWFAWDSNNANQFFSLFGRGFKEYIEDLICNDDAIDAAVKAFLELGRDRNMLVHNDFLNCSYDKTVDEIYETYLKAKSFVELFPDILIEYAKISEGN